MSVKDPQKEVANIQSSMPIFPSPQVTKPPGRRSTRFMMEDEVVAQVSRDEGDPLGLLHASHLIDPDLPDGKGDMEGEDQDAMDHRRRLQGSPRRNLGMEGGFGAEAPSADGDAVPLISGGGQRRRHQRRSHHRGGGSVGAGSGLGLDLDEDDVLGGTKRGRLLRSRSGVTSLMGAGALWKQGFSGKGVKVGVFDTGIKVGSRIDAAADAVHALPSDIPILHQHGLLPLTELPLLASIRKTTRTSVTSRTAATGLTRTHSATGSDTAPLSQVWKCVGDAYDEYIYDCMCDVLSPQSRSLPGRLLGVCTHSYSLAFACQA